MFKVTWTNNETLRKHSWIFYNKAEMKDFVIELRLTRTKYHIKSINPHCPLLVQASS